jgi:hypothetical protein
LSRSLPLALLPPDIVEAIFSARADQTLMLERPLPTTGEPFLASDRHLAPPS